MTTELPTAKVFEGAGVSTEAGAGTRAGAEAGAGGGHHPSVGAGKRQLGVSSKQAGRLRQFVDGAVVSAGAGARGAGAGAICVVPVTPLDCGELFPAASYADTVYM